ncbi:MAG: hypothetical protein M1275_00640 [Patescibacteria group bacterium]|nr:hypothetical protein [Patescibacteria group bacterium]
MMVAVRDGSRKWRQATATAGGQDSELVLLVTIELLAVPAFVVSRFLRSGFKSFLQRQERFEQAREETSLISFPILSPPLVRVADLFTDGHMPSLNCEFLAFLKETDDPAIKAAPKISFSKKYVKSNYPEKSPSFLQQILVKFL